IHHVPVEGSHAVKSARRSPLKSPVVSTAGRSEASEDATALGPTTTFAMIFGLYPAALMVRVYLPTGKTSEYLPSALVVTDTPPGSMLTRAFTMACRSAPGARSRRPCRGRAGETLRRGARG